MLLGYVINDKTTRDMKHRVMLWGAALVALLSSAPKADACSRVLSSFAKTTENIVNAYIAADNNVANLFS